MENILSPEELDSKLSKLKEEGFDQIKLPGGTSKDRKHYSGVAITFYNPEDKQLYFLGLPYDSSFHKNGDENGNTKKEGENPLQTAVREAMEETGLIIEEEDLEEIESSKRELLSKGFPKILEHTKHFFLARRYSGHVFEFPGANKIDRETAAPLWIPAKKFKEVLWPGHQKAFQDALGMLAVDVTFFKSISTLL